MKFNLQNLLAIASYVVLLGACVGSPVTVTSQPLIAANTQQPTIETQPTKAPTVVPTYEPIGMVEEQLPAKGQAVNPPNFLDKSTSHEASDFDSADANVLYQLYKMVNGKGVFTSAEDFMAKMKQFKADYFKKNPSISELYARRDNIVSRAIVRKNTNGTFSVLFSFNADQNLAFPEPGLWNPDTHAAWITVPGAPLLFIGPDDHTYVGIVKNGKVVSWLNTYFGNQDYLSQQLIPVDDTGESTKEFVNNGWVAAYVGGFKLTDGKVFNKDKSQAMLPDGINKIDKLVLQRNGVVWALGTDGTVLAEEIGGIWATTLERDCNSAEVIAEAIKGTDVEANNQWFKDRKMYSDSKNSESNLPSYSLAEWYKIQGVVQQDITAGGKYSELFVFESKVIGQNFCRVKDAEGKERIYHFVYMPTVTGSPIELPAIPFAVGYVNDVGSYVELTMPVSVEAPEKPVEDFFAQPISQKIKSFPNAKEAVQFWQTMQDKNAQLSLRVMVEAEEGSIDSLRDQGVQGNPGYFNFDDPDYIEAIGDFPLKFREYILAFKTSKTYRGNMTWIEFWPLFFRFIQDNHYIGLVSPTAITTEPFSPVQ